MTRPKVKVALATGRNSLQFRTAGLEVLNGNGRSISNHIDGLLTVTLADVQMSASKNWIWCGVFADKQGIESIISRLTRAGIAGRLWEIGLSPGEDDWKIRQYRLLVAEDALEQLRSRHTDFPELDLTQSLTISLPETAAKGTLVLQSDSSEIHVEDKVIFRSTASIELAAAPVGEGFHWEHTEDLTFSDPIWIEIGRDGKLCCGIDVDIEDYLASVNSSEMPAESPLELLKAQVVAARSWLLANWGSHHPGETFNICNGDHCQCYYGPQRMRENSRRAADETAGELLTHEGHTCDARYAKTCGGVTEPAANVWPLIDEPYLGHVRDLPGAEAPDLSIEARFREFLADDQGGSCCAPDYAPFSGRLAKLAELYRWHITVTKSELSGIIKYKTGTDLGEMHEIVPGRRGPSGRLIEVRVTGSKGHIDLQPELEIRRVLSETHLPSSAFWIETTSDRFIFHGMGWGHGVGLCQMGATGLALKGMGYREILEHYYPNTSIEKIY